MPIPNDEAPSEGLSDELTSFLASHQDVEFSPEQQSLVDQLMGRERARTRSKNRELRAVEKERQLFEDRLTVALSIEAHDRPKIPSLKAKGIKTRRRHPSGEAIMVCVASDWHVEEYVDPEMVNGRNHYNLEIAWERSRHYFRSVLWMLDKERFGAKIDTVVLAVLGDLITGHIHEEFKENNQLSPIEATQVVLDMLTEGIQKLLKEGKMAKLIIPTCYGNHGRVNPWKVISKGYAHSYEWMMYHHLAERFRGEKRVHFKIEKSYHNFLTLFPGKGQTVIRFHHGDHMRYGGGVGGITIPVRKAIAEWNKFIRADLDVFGHFHQRIDGETWICNGSLIGYNAYAISIKAAYEPPRQTGFLVRPDRGKVESFPIFVTDDEG